MAPNNVSYCKDCGCYIPDNWTECPACHQYVRSIQSSPLAQAVLRGERIQPIPHKETYSPGGRGYSLSQYRVVTRRPSPTYLRTCGIPLEPRCLGEVLFREDIQRVFVADENLQWVVLMRYDELINRKSIYDGILGNASVDKMMSSIEERLDKTMSDIDKILDEL